MDITVAKASELSHEEVEAWKRIQRSSTALDSPFYAVEFTQAAARCQPGIEVAVMRRDAQYAGFLPFQRSGWRIARPVAWKVNDFQGAILAQNTEVDAVDLLRQCGLVQWSFDHLPLTQQWCRHAHTIHHASPYVDLTAGYTAYVAEKNRDSGNRIKTTLRKARKLAREVGELRFEFDCQEQEVFHRLLRWKSQQLDEMKVFNILKAPWALSLLDLLRAGRSDACRGLLSATWAGNELMAAHFGLMNSGVIHWWITSYNSAFQAYSPGLILLLNLIEHAAARGIHRIDLGKGTEPYKLSVQTGATTVMEGTLASSRLRQVACRVAHGLRERARASSWLRAAVRQIKRARNHLSCHDDLRQLSIAEPREDSVDPSVTPDRSGERASL